MLSPQDWHDRVAGYLNWSADAAPQPADNALAAILSGIDRCSDKVTMRVIYTNESVSTLDENSTEAQWERAFFPSNLTVEGDHGLLMKKALEEDLTLLGIHSQRDFSYSGSLVDLGTNRRTEFFLYPESDVSPFSRKGGNYLLVCTSKVTFSNGQRWRSPRNAIALFAPESSSIRSFIIKTRVFCHNEP